jgi:prepilin peptidase CpaA
VGLALLLLQVASITVFCSVMISAAASDMLSMTIANRISILLVVAFGAIAPFTGMDPTTYGWHFAAGAIVLAVTFLLFALNAMGGGDAKLIAATAVWMGPGVPLAQYLVWGAMLGGVLTLALLALRYSPLAAPASHTRLFRHLANRQAGIPYGIALGAAGLLAFPSSPLGAWALAQM